MEQYPVASRIKGLQDSNDQHRIQNIHFKIKFLEQYMQEFLIDQILFYFYQLLYWPQNLKF